MLGHNFPWFEFRSYLDGHAKDTQYVAHKAFYRRQLAGIDSIILAQGPRWEDTTSVEELTGDLTIQDEMQLLTSEALENNAAAPGNYRNVKALDRLSPYGTALEALAEYRRPEDIEFIRAQGKDALGAIARFPAPEFWPWLSSLNPLDFAQDEFRLPEYYQAVVSYQNQASEQLLQAHLGADRLPGAKYLLPILLERKNPLYDSLQAQLYGRK